MMSDKVDLESIPIPKMKTDSIPLPTADSFSQPVQSSSETKSTDKTRKKFISVRYNIETSKPKPPDVPTKLKGRWDKLPGEKGTHVAKSSINISAKTSRLITKGEEQMSQTIVDDFFKDFIATKMKQIEEEYKDGDKKQEISTDQVITSVEEMNKLLDEEINQIGKNTNNQYVHLLKTDKLKKQSHPSLDVSIPKESIDSENGDNSAMPVGRLKTDKNPPISTHDSTDSTPISTDDTMQSVATSSSSVAQKGPKKIGLLQLGIRISDNSAALISSGIPADETSKKKTLEEGEVLSSGEDSDSEEDEDKGVEEEVSDEEDDDNVSETGSLSDSDKETKSTKSKKKKKKKHKHKKKKKHKASKEKDKEKDKEGKPGDKSKRKHTHKSRSRSRSPKRRRSSSLEKKKSKKRTHSESKTKYFTKPLEVKYEFGTRSRDADRSRGEDRGSHRRSRSRSRSREKDKTAEDLRLKIDKAKLRQIAIKNALANAKTGQGPQVDLLTMKAGGKSVAELTDFCKRISSRQRHTGDTSSSDDESQQPMQADDEEGPFIHHPFKLRETNPNIVLNIRNAKQLPVVTPQEKMCQQATLRLQFPVSSGTVHRQSEPEWVPVEKSKTPALAAATTTTVTKAPTPTVSTPATSATPAASAVSTVALPAADAAETDSKIFPDPPKQPIDIGSIISERLQAVRKLAANPTDMGAMTAMQKAQQKASLWATSKQLPGQFLGSTGAQIMSQQELMGPDKRHQAWLKKIKKILKRRRREFSKKFSTVVVKKILMRSLNIKTQDQFTRAAPLKGGIGMLLLQKMGWKQGEGLGRNNEGSKEPLLLDVKTDRRGLTSQGESTKRIPHGPMVRDLSGKHPVSALVELCNKRKWGPPDFQVVSECGPDHKKNFLFKVVVNGTEYQPPAPSNNKKTAKAMASTICLQQLGLVPRGT